MNVNGTKKKGAKELTMHVRVYSPFKVYFDGQSMSISGENATWAFRVWW